MSGQKFLSDTPYDVKSLCQVKYTYEGDALEDEKKFLEALKKSRYIPKKHFSGHTECFLADGERVRKIIELMKRQRNFERHPF
ncbi:hypothetical protein [Pseudoalteromonas sp. OOF1S-7]|uniref:hypothetical protein n=1 Tax=Pseudoalteromonas sp. OOF1S-7 TaxID=2917757 RepID=UPI001EF41EDF|nr:hypothetical protein [Pseudoalteromonas sp. OOF1S-7]MCG7537281.1 hypothetical protein [Pseudoalteromonas sp. OOF1S-7]